jgi:hypothetical protein|tara:strand:+ start:239 stop:550 length:312 start_codon:yes stop_codon:yes gene_type:complete
MAGDVDYIADMYNANIKKVVRDLFETNRQLAYAQTILRALRNPDMIVEGGPMTVDRIQSLENGDVTILPPKPVIPKPAETAPNDLCVQEASKNGSSSKKMAVS